MTPHASDPLFPAHSPPGRLIVVCGLPGSGKTTLATALESQSNTIRFSADDWMDALNIDLYDEPRRAAVEALQWTLCRRLLQAGLTVIVEWGTWARSERDQLRLGARELGASVELHYLHAPRATLFRRIRRRAKESPPISRSALDQWLRIFQPPSAEELALFDPPTRPTSVKQTDAILSGMATNLDRDLIEAALVGLKHQRSVIEDQIQRLERMLRQGGSSAAAHSQAPSTTSKAGPAAAKRGMSDAARKRIAAAQKKRWAAFRAAKRK